jgi:hypothetical protein
VHGREVQLPICIVQILLNLETRTGNALNIFKGFKPVGSTYTSGWGWGGGGPCNLFVPIISFLVVSTVINY